jgi:hypothetical protein
MKQGNTLIPTTLHKTLQPQEMFKQRATENDQNNDKVRNMKRSCLAVCYAH